MIQERVAVQSQRSDCSLYVKLWLVQYLSAVFCHGHGDGEGVSTSTVNSLVRRRRFWAKDVIGPHGALLYP